jgi:hypothetical protein
VSWAPAILINQETEIRKTVVSGKFGQIVQETLSRKYPTQKRAGGVAQVVELLPSQGETWSSNPNNATKKKKKKRVEW